MTIAELRALRRTHLLRVLEAAHPARLPQANLQANLRLAGFIEPEHVITDDLLALVEQGHLTSHAHPLSPALKHYGITDSGIAALS